MVGENVTIRQNSWGGLQYLNVTLTEKDTNDKEITFV